MFNFVLLVLFFVFSIYYVICMKLKNFLSKKNLNSLRGPIPLPVIGSMHLLGQYATPFEGFTALSKIYGDIYAIYLGSVPCVVVNNFSLIKEVLIKKGVQFGGRPDYLRYHRLFGGDRNNCKLNFLSFISNFSTNSNSRKVERSGNFKFHDSFVWALPELPVYSPTKSGLFL